MKTNRNHTRTRQRNQQRGTVILLALAVLAVLSLVGVTYITIVRVDRDSAVATTKQQDFDRQVAVVIGRMRDILTADLFGNKNVTRTVPRGPLDDSFYPKFMEDGEYSDYPSTHIFRSGITANSFGEVRDARLAPRRGVTDNSAPVNIAPIDDAWLASTEPLWDRNNINNTDRWGQITNLRATYEWNDPGQEWLRMDGRFVDLAQWFLNPIDGRANTSLNLLSFGGDINGTGGGRTAIGPIAGIAFNPVTNALTNNTTVYNRQIAELDQVFGGNDQTLTGADERLWADTDGDLRADARWTQLEELGNLYDRQWLVAARIIDASALVNFNTAIEFPHRGLLARGPNENVPSNTGAPNRKAADLMGTGVTPADVDLYRLLTYNHGNANPSSVFINPGGGVGPLDLNNIATGSAFANHLEEGLDIDRILITLGDFDVRPTDGSVSNPIHQYFDEDNGYRWQPLANPLTRAQRSSLYRNATGSATDRRIQSGQLYSARELIDLRAFWGTNNRAVTSKFEQYIDGPESAGLLPSAAGAPVALGPLRAGEDPLQARSFTAQTPNLEQLFFDRRKHLTPTSGVASYSPVPALNNAPGAANSGAAIEKINFNQLRLFANNLTNAYTRVARGGNPTELLDARDLIRQPASQVFDAFTWSLMPYATNKVLSRELLASQAAFDFHYGGGTGGFVNRLITGTPESPFATSPITPQQTNATFALWTSLALTANLIDAIDQSASDNEVPTILRFIPNDGADRNLPASNRNFDILLNHERAQGTIVDAALTTGPVNLLGGLAVDTGGISVIGLDQQPFLSELATFAVYEAEGVLLYEGQDLLGGRDANLDLAEPTTHVGSIIAVELANPWPEDVDATDYYVHLQSQNDIFAASSLQLHLDAQPGVNIIPAGATQVFYYAHPPRNIDPEWDIIVDEWAQSIVDQSNDPAAQDPIELSNARGIGTIPTSSRDGRSSLETGVLRLSNPDPVTMDGERVVFQRFAELTAGGSPQALTIAVQLRRKLKVHNLPTFIELEDILVDRMAQGTRMDLPDAFFGGLSTANNTTFTVNAADNEFGPRLGLPDDVLRRTVPFVLRAAAHGSIRRPKAHARPNAGAPPYVYEIPELNRIERYPDVNGALPVPGGAGAGAEREPYLQIVAGIPGAMSPPGQSQGFLVFERLPTPATELATENDNNRARKLNILDTSETTRALYPEVQLFVPNRTLDTVADLHMISRLAHIYIHRPSDNPVNSPGPRTSTAPTSGANQPFKDNFSSNTGSWFTFSEQLGWDANFYADTANSIPNPYALTLDPTRYIPAADLRNPQTAGASAPLSPINTVPLALRVFDCFEAINLPGFLAQGRVNINTAPIEVLQTLPLIDPFNDLPTASPILSANTAFSRGELIAAYRDRTNLASGINFSVNRGRTLNLNNLRTDELPRIATPGELAVMGVWDTARPFDPALNANAGTFLEVAAGSGGAGVASTTNTPPFELWSDGFSPSGAPYDPSDNRAYANRNYNPTDDPEERLALYRAISNIVSSRSDVFMATFVLRAYDPDVVESIETDGSLNGALDAMADDRFRPDYETRWLVVFDRSNVRSPLDRPRVLLQVQLPPATP